VAIFLDFAWGAAVADLFRLTFTTIDLPCLESPCRITFTKGGASLPKSTTGAVGANSKEVPSSFVGSGPSCACKKARNQRGVNAGKSKLHLARCGAYLCVGDLILGMDLLKHRPQRLPEHMGFPHIPPDAETIGGKGK
jgi:hypothetical protein